MAKSLWSGLCALVPLPFVDDWARDVVRRRLMRSLVVQSGLDASDETVKILAEGTPTPWAKGCLRSTVFWPVRFLYKLLVKKVLRKLVFLLAIKDAVDTFSVTFHEGYLVRHVLFTAAWRSSESRQPHRIEPDDARRIRQAIESTRGEIDHRPIERWVRAALDRSRTLIRGNVRRLSRGLGKMRRADRQDDERFYQEVERDTQGLDPMIDELTAEISGERGYLDRLESLVEARLAAAPMPHQHSTDAAET